MSKKSKTIIIILSIYLVVFWVGYRAGELVTRGKYTSVEKVTPHDTGKVGSLAAGKSGNRIFIIVQKYKPHGNIDISEVTVYDLHIRMLRDKNLRPLLRKKNIKVYLSNGRRIY